MEKKYTADLTEDELIQQFFAPVAEGLGDDVAVIDPDKNEELLISTDSLIEDVHFLRQSPAELVGEKALRVNASDIAASGGVPRWVTLAVSLPRDLELSWLRGFIDGFARAMQAIGIRLIGGDTTASPDRIAIGVTVLGSVARGQRVTRVGAAPGDLIAVTGNLGEAFLGLQAVLGKADYSEEDTQHWLDRHFRPVFRGPLAVALAQKGLASSMMDLSDGVASDLPRLCKASGVGAELILEDVPLSKRARAAGQDARGALCGGEDYELLFTVKAENWRAVEKLALDCDTPLTRIGQVVVQPGLRLFDNGHLATEPLVSWQHF